METTDLNRVSRAVRYLLAVLVLLPFQIFAWFVSGSLGWYLAEGETGIDRLTGSYAGTAWIMFASGAAGLAGIALYRKIMGWRARSWWLWLALVWPIGGTVALALIPGTNAPIS